MADEVDIANEQVERNLKAHLSHRKPVDAIGPRGYCYNPSCELDLPKEEQLFCGSECARQYERLKK